MGKAKTSESAAAAAALLKDGAKDVQEVDLWRDTPLRYLGYANEVGEAFRYVLPALLGASYALSFGYVAGDVLDKGRRAFVAQGRRLSPTVVVGSLDCFVWQTLASVLVPGAIIHKVVDAAKWGVAKGAPGKETLLRGLVSARAVPVMAGLATIPFVVEPIDHAVTVAMDATVRKAYPLLNVQGLGSQPH